MNTNDIIEVDLTVRDSETKELLDTTIEKTAKDENAYNEKISYKPLKIIFGKGELLPTVEENIKDLVENKTKEFSLTKDKAFGEKDTKKIQLVPIAEFKKQNIVPKAGMHINFGNAMGKVISVSGGRVQVDFNHELAGRDLDYTITLKKVYNEDKAKVDAMVEKYFYFFPKDAIETNFNKDTVEVILPQQVPKEIEYLKYAFTQILFDICSGVENVKFAQVFKKPKQQVNKK